MYKQPNIIITDSFLHVYTHNIGILLKLMVSHVTVIFSLKYLKQLCTAKYVDSNIMETCRRHDRHKKKKELEEGKRE